MFSRHWLRGLSNTLGRLHGPRGDRQQRGKARATLAVQALEERLVLARPVGSNVAFQTYALSDIFNLSSNPTSTHKIYLDFDGHTFTNNAWQPAPWSTPAFSWDAD